MWILQVLLAIAFVGAGGMKLAVPKDRVRDRMGWVDDFGQGQIRAIGAIEVLGGLGLVLPAATGIAPVLTPIAAAGLSVAMLLAVLVHLRRRDPAQETVPSIVFLLLCLLTLFGLLAVGRA